MVSQDDDPVYVKIEDPAEVRKALLQSIKHMIMVLQANEKLQEKKKQKSGLAEEYRDKMKDIIILLAKIKSQMPKVKVSNLPKRTAKPEKVEESAEPELVEVNISEADRLENELKEIEAKLNSL